MIDPCEVLRSELVRAAETLDARATAPAEASGRLRWPGWFRRRSRPLALVAAALVISGSAATTVRCGSVARTGEARALARPERKHGGAAQQ
jgi:hypothetical protein